MKVEREVTIPVQWDDERLEVGFRADLILENQVIVELKSVEAILPVHKKQLLTYLRLANCSLGLLLNFGSVLLNDGIYRVVNELEE